MKNTSATAGAVSPLHPGFVNAGSTLLIAAFVTDVMYCKTSIWQWANFSAWLISAGLVLALVATIVLIMDLLIGRVRRISWWSFAVVAAAALLSLVNVFVHSRDSWTSVMPPGVKLADLPAGPIDHHWTKALAASLDGSKLYVGVGSNSNIVENGFAAEDGRAAIYEIDRRSGAKRIYASGTRNPTNLAVNPQTGRLFAVVNERDEIGPDLVPDYLTMVQDGAFYGWPYSYWGQHVDVRVHPQKPEMVAKAIKPDYGLSSHVATLGLAFSQGETLSPAFANGVFVGEHGSWDRSPLNGYQVIFVPLVNGRPAGTPIPVITGFVGEDGKTVRGRPVGVALDRTGALLVADDAGDVIWRVSANGSARRL